MENEFPSITRFPTKYSVGDALEDLEQSGLVALTGPSGAYTRVVSPLNSNIWDWFTSLTGVYNITDHQGRFGRKGAKVNVVAHGIGHPLNTSRRVREVLRIEYNGGDGTTQLTEKEEIDLLSDEGTPIFAYNLFLGLSEDPHFLIRNPSFRIVRSLDVLNRTKCGVQPLRGLYNNSSMLCYAGGRTPVNVTTPEGEEKIVTIAQALVDRTAQRFDKDKLGIFGYHRDQGGRVLSFGNSRAYIFYTIIPNSMARFVGTDIEDEISNVAPNLEHTLED